MLENASDIDVAKIITVKKQKMFAVQIAYGLVMSSCGTICSEMFIFRNTSHYMDLSIGISPRGILWLIIKKRARSAISVYAELWRRKWRTTMRM